jgi:hypothetical protein
MFSSDMQEVKLFPTMKETRILRLLSPYTLLDKGKKGNVG